MIKGYVVKGKHFGTGATMWLAYEPTGEHVVAPRASQRTTFQALASAIQAWCDAQVMCLEPRIFAVAEDGTETLLPSYEEALAQWREDARQMQALYEETHRALDAAVVERDALRAERDTERKAWARLVKATTEERDAAACAIAERERGVRGGYIALEQRELMAARQALRDLGVGVDALLAD